MITRSVESPPREKDLLQSSDVFWALGLVWRYKWRMLLLMLIGVGTGYAYYRHAPLAYQSRAEVLVVKRGPQTFAGLESSYYEDDVSTHEKLIRSPLFVQKAVEQANLAELPSLKGLNNPSVAIINGLSVSMDSESPTSPSRILTLTYRCGLREDCSKVLEAMIAYYQTFLDETSRSVNEDALQMITQKAEAVLAELKEKEDAFHKFRQDSAVPWNSDDGIALYQSRLTSIEEQRTTLSIQRAETEYRLNALRRAIKEGKDDEQLLAMIPHQDFDKSVESLEKHLYPLVMEERSLVEDFGDGHPDVRLVRQKIKFTKDMFARDSTFRAQLLENHNLNESADPVENHIKVLERELSLIASSNEALKGLLAEERDKARELTNIEFEANRLSGEVARTRQYYESLITQLQSVNFGKDLVGYTIRVMAPPRRAAQVAPRIVVILAAATLISALLSLLWAFIADSTQKCFRTTSDVARGLGLPVVGSVPIASAKSRIDRNGSEHPELDSGLYTVHHPLSTEAEAYRGLRTALYFNTRRDGCRILLATSPSVGDGKSSLISNLAVSIAKSGKRVLVVDADLRRPRMHQIFHVNSEIGLSNIIREEAEVQDAIRETVVPRLWVLPAGPRVASSSDLLTSNRFSEVLEYLRDQYDFVLVDAPALLAVSDARVVATNVDGVLMLVRLAKNSRPPAERATEILHALDANLLGVVVNTAEGEFAAYDYDSNDDRPYVSEPVLAATT